MGLAPHDAVKRVLGGPLGGSDWSLTIRPHEALPSEHSCETLWIEPSLTYTLQRPLEPGPWNLVVRHGGIASSAIDLAARAVLMVPADPGTSDEMLQHLWLDRLLPGLLDWTGVLTLHAGAVDLDGAGVLFVAPSGHGKSTLTASLASTRTPALNDDGIVVRTSGSGFDVEPIYAGLRLLPDSRARLLPDAPATPLSTHYAWKDRIHLPEGLSTGPVPLAAIFVLGGQNPEVKVRRLPPALACMKLIEQSFALDPTDHTRAATRLRQAAAVAAKVPAFALDYPRDYDRLPEVHAALFATLDGVTPQP